MSVDKARFRNPVFPDCELHLEIEAVRSHGRVWKYKGLAKVKGTKMAYAGLKNEKDRASIIIYLNEQGDSPLPLP